jgi:hypothetical protein
MEKLQGGLENIESDLCSLADSFVMLSQHSKAFLLSSPQPALPKQLLQELQQQLQLHMLLPSALLQWAVDMPISSSSLYSTRICCAASSLIDYHHQALQDGPASLYQHMTGQKRPQAKPQKQKSGRLGPAQSASVQLAVPASLPGDVLQLLARLVQGLLQTWAASLGLEDSLKTRLPCVAPAAGDSDTDCRVPMASGAGSKTPDTDRSAISRHMLQMPPAVSAAGTLVLKLAERFPILKTDTKASNGGSSSQGAAGAAGQLCALLESLCRMELAAEQHLVAMQTAQASSGNGSTNSSSPACRVSLSRMELAVEQHLTTMQAAQASSSSGSTNSNAPACSVRNVSKELPASLAPAQHDGTGFTVGPLVDPIIAHSSPGSKPYKQLCSLLSNMLKTALHDSRCTPGVPLKGAMPAPADADSMGSPVQNAVQVEHPSLCASLQVACAVMDAATARYGGRATTRKANSKASSRSSNGVSGGNSDNAGEWSDAAGMLSVLPLLGRCCLQMRDAAASVTTVDGYDAPDKIERLGSVVRASTAWLSAGSNAAQVTALGYNTEGVLQCLTDAAAVSNAARDGLIDSTPPEAIVSQIQEQLLSVGRALTSFAHPSACNNPACVTFSGPSDVSLVQRSSSKCSSCRSARYCSKSCQSAAWKQHRPVCKVLTAAAAAATAAGKPEAAV